MTSNNGNKNRENWIVINFMTSCSLTTIPIDVTFRTCHAVDASIVYGRMNSGIGFTMRWMT